VRYTEGRHYEIYHYAPKPDDTVILEAPMTSINMTWQNLRRSTQASRATLATSQESRQIALKHLPHSIPFRLHPIKWINDKGEVEEPADGSNHYEHILRFNGARDIIVFQDATWADQEAVVKISKLQGRVPDAFMEMEHVGISMRSFICGNRLDPGGERGSYGVTENECDCSTGVCRDACQYEPLPHFLSCFPALKAFYIARVSTDAEDGGDEVTGTSAPIENADCHCKFYKDGDISSEPEHKWPVIKSSDIDRWCVVWDERTGCIPVHSCVGIVRQYWRSNFPYYKEMEHLDIRFIRRIDPASNRELENEDLMMEDRAATRTGKVLRSLLTSLSKVSKQFSRY